MTADVVELDSHRPHNTGPAICIVCRHEWVAVAPAGTIWFECPGCGVHQGRFLGPCQRSGLHWTCNCGSDVFHLTPRGPYCPHCGVWSSWQPDGAGPRSAA